MRPKYIDSQAGCQCRPPCRRVGISGMILCDYMKKQNVVIIGQGEIGKAVHSLLKMKHRVAIECWDVDVKACPIKKPLEDVVPNSDFLFLCIPSWAIRVAAKDIVPHLKKTTTVVSVSKGIDRNGNKTVDELLKEVFPKTQPVALLSGPMLAEEIMAGKLSAAVVASRAPAIRNRVMALFEKTPLRLAPTDDMRGAALCGVLKNVYTIGFAAASELGAGDNYRGYYLMLAHEEMGMILNELGGCSDTAYSYAGLGDFIATAFSRYSKNNEYGTTLAKEGRVLFESEGSISIRPLKELLGKKFNRFCLLARIGEIVERKRAPNSILKI
jgi:glycerol-3-phosphate dehydrogenase